MCRGSEVEAGGESGWFTGLPRAPGDHVWLSVWSCGCVREAGVAWVFETTPDDARNDHCHVYSPAPESWLAVNWACGRVPFSGRGRPDVDFWRRVVLPDPDTVADRPV